MVEPAANDVRVAASTRLGDLPLAAELVRSAGRLAARMRDEGLSTVRKTSVSDVVTAADHAAEALIAERLHRERPDDGIVGEEGTNDPGARTWFVDPVDGTYNFACGLPTWCAALALHDPAGAVLGAVFEPVLDQLWLGGRDHPATLNGTELARLVDRPLAECSVATYLHPTALSDPGLRDPLLRAIAPSASLRMLGSGSIELAAVAAGRIGVYVQADCLDWDWFPGQALVEAAGGTTTVFGVGAHRWHIAGNAQVVAEVAALLRTT